MLLMKSNHRLVVVADRAADRGSVRWHANRRPAGGKHGGPLWEAVLPPRLAHRQLHLWSHICCGSLRWLADHRQSVRRPR